MGRNLGSEQAEGYQVCCLVRDRLGKKRLGVALQQACIVADQVVASVRNAHLSSSRPAQTEANARRREPSVEMSRRQITQLGG